MVALKSKIAISSIEIIGTLIWLEVSVKASIPLPGLIICIHHPPLSPALPPTLGSLMIRAYVLARYTAVRAPSGQSTELESGGPELKSHPDR